jgi:hypothetical protein
MVAAGGAFVLLPGTWPALPLAITLLFAVAIGAALLVRRRRR